MARFSLELSDGIDELARQFQDYTHEARVLDPADAITLISCCRLLKERARQLENEVSAKRWNEAAHSERAMEERRLTETVICELDRPDTNLMPFPVVHRPFNDGMGGRSA